MATKMEVPSDLDSQKTEDVEDASPIYRHHRLSANTTRVLHILPSTRSDQSDTISCRLSVIPLNPSPPEYRALSYVWGDPSVTRVILVDGREFEVRINLGNYLYQARKEGYIDLLWVDAICIDQTNLAERSAQVAIMGQIYSKAFEVRAWLGMATERNLEAMQLLEEVDWQKQAIQLKSENCFSLAREQIEAICEILDSQYWSRIWVIQEYILASCVSVQCGLEIVAGTTLECMANAVEMNRFHMASSSSLIWGTNHDHTDLPDLNKTAGYRIIWARMLHTRHSLSPSRYGFAMLLYQSLQGSGSRCTDLHDYLYALLSLNKIASEEIVPDYTKPLSQLFLDLVHFFDTRPIPSYEHMVGRTLFMLAVQNLKERWELEDCAEACQAYQDLTDYIHRANILAITSMKKS